MISDKGNGEASAEFQPVAFRNLAESMTGASSMTRTAMAIAFALSSMIGSGSLRGRG